VEAEKLWREDCSKFEKLAHFDELGRFSALAVILPAVDRENGMDRVQFVLINSFQLQAQAPN
jgi:hypothetical protein